MTPSDWLGVIAQAVPVVFAAGMVYRELRGITAELASFGRRLEAIEGRVRSLEELATRNRERLRSLERAVFRWHGIDDNGGA